MSEEKRRFKAVIGDKTYTIIGPGSEQHFITVTKLLNEVRRCSGCMWPVMG